MDDLIYDVDPWTADQWARFEKAWRRGVKRLAPRTHAPGVWDKFAEEAFAVTYGAPSTVPARPEHEWAAKVFGELSGLPDFAVLQARAKGDRHIAGLAAESFSSVLAQRLQSPPVSLVDPEPIRAKVRGLLAMGISSGPELDELRAEGRAAVAAAKDYADSLTPEEIREALRAALRRALTDVDEEEARFGGLLGWGSSANLTAEVLAPDTKSKLAEKVRDNAKLRELVEKAGRWRRVARDKQRTKVRYARNEVSDIERGADLARVLPSELAKLGHPVTKPDFLLGFVEARLLQYKLSGTERANRGPIVVCVDQSTSMEGRKEIDSKAVAIGLVQVATEQRRDAVVIHFNGKVVGEHHFRPPNVDPFEILTAMSYFYGGGTSWTEPLDCALRVIDRTLPKADIVLITDDECDVPDEWLDAFNVKRKGLGVQVYGVSIGGSHGSMDKFADEVLVVRSVDEAAARLMDLD